jgi:3-methyladenine DNA glycosylase AlkD
MRKEISEDVRLILEEYDPSEPQPTAESLRQLWLGYEPKSMGGIKAEQRTLQETVGTPVAILKAIGNEIGKPARKRVSAFLPLAQLLWNEYGREGRIVATPLLGKMELLEPETVLPLLMELCRSCHTWEDADQLAMNALEPIVRKDPGNWLQAMDSWLADENKWVRRAGVTVVGRLPMKRSEYTERCLDMIELLLLDQETDVKRAVSFAIRISARGSVEAVRDFLTRHVPPKDPAATWVLCDVIRSMTKRTLPELISLLPQYEQWAANPALSGKDRRSVESAVRILRSTQN